MLKQAYAAGFDAALAQYQLKDAGLKEKLLPLALATGIGGGGTAALAAAKHMAQPRPVQQMATQELPSAGGAFKAHFDKLDTIANAR